MTDAYRRAAAAIVKSLTSTGLVPDTDPDALADLTDTTSLLIETEMRAATRSGPLTLEETLRLVRQERAQQDVQWGEQNHPDGTGPDARWDGETFASLAHRTRLHTQAAANAGALTWRNILLEEVMEAMAENDPVQLADELTQVAAVAVAWVEALARRWAKEQTAARPAPQVQVDIPGQGSVRLDMPEGANVLTIDPSTGRTEWAQNSTFGGQGVRGEVSEP